MTASGGSEVSNEGTISSDELELTASGSERLTTHFRVDADSPALLHAEVGFTGQRIAERIASAVLEPELDAVA